MFQFLVDRCCLEVLIGAVVFILKQVGIAPKVWNDVKMSVSNLFLTLLRFLIVIVLNYDDPVVLVFLLLDRVCDDAEEPNKEDGQNCYAGENCIYQGNPIVGSGLVFEVHLRSSSAGAKRGTGASPLPAKCYIMES